MRTSVFTNGRTADVVQSKEQINVNEQRDSKQYRVSDSIINDIFGIAPDLSDLYDAVILAERKCRVDLSETKRLIQTAEDRRIEGKEDWHAYEQPILDSIRGAMTVDPSFTGFPLERLARKVLVDEPKKSGALDEVFA